MGGYDVVHVIDDDLGVQAAIVSLCKTVSLPVRQYGDIMEFDARRERSETGCALLDLRLPKLGGIPGIEHVRREHPDLAIIVISGHGDVRLVAHAMRAGASDFFQKPFDPQELLDSVQIEISRAGQRRVGSDVQVRLELLSRRQSEIMRLLALGETEMHIAERLQLHLKSVQRHRKKALELLRLERGDERKLEPYFR